MQKVCPVYYCAYLLVISPKSVNNLDGLYEWAQIHRQTGIEPNSLTSTTITIYRAHSFL